MKNIRRLVVVAFVVMLAFLPISSSLGREDRIKPGEYEGYNLIMIAINNIGTEHMSLYGYKRRTTPNIDKWSKNAFTFESAFSPSSWTLPVATAVFTSLYPYSHKLMNRFRGNSLKGIKTLAEILKENNYTTAAFTGGLDYKQIFGHMKGFDATDNNDNFSKFYVTFSQADKWLSGNSDKKFFLFIHGYDAHPPFEPPKEFKGIYSKTKGKKISVNPKFTIRGFKNSKEGYRAYYIIKPNDPSRANTAFTEKTEVELTQDDIDYLRDLYDEEVLSVDSQVGKFLNNLPKKVLNKTVIVIFSEHGEMFAKHGRFGRAGSIRGALYDEVVHIPLLIKVPRVKGKRINGLAQLIDIMPTILDILNIPPSVKGQGKSLLPLINASSPVNDYIFGGAVYNKERPDPYPYYDVQSINEYIRDNKWKLIHEINFGKTAEGSSAGSGDKEIFELYDIVNDPEEYNDLSGRYPLVLRDLQEKLIKWKRWSGRYLPGDLSVKKIPKSLIDDARDHGYW